ncbi:rhodanese-like domain-containing protein [Vibrio rhodolitus]|uniref:rhodanese-like domain-containing protein n=1 Tax=Vibrio rhodolitus TaxID=2231649 RepID=UPI000E0B2E27|nr:rhodanese-like domain-containing protein [Vibrio rhodolitus]
MRKVFHLLALSLCLSLSVFAVHASERAQIGWEKIQQGAMVVDVRTPQEFAAGHLDNAVNFPLADLDKHFANMDKNQPIVVYCRSGNRSGIAYDYLVEQGFTQVHNGGGLVEMQSAK